MNPEKILDSRQFSTKLQAIATATQDAVEVCQGDVIALLALLRQLEKLHGEIRDGVFQENLPDNRQLLYSLLKDIESAGGWPYIGRMRLRELLINITQAEFSLNNPVPQKMEDDLVSEHYLEW